MSSVNSPSQERSFPISRSRLSSSQVLRDCLSLCQMSQHTLGQSVLQRLELRLLYLLIHWSESGPSQWELSHYQHLVNLLSPEHRRYLEQGLEPEPEQGPKPQQNPV